MTLASPSRTTLPFTPHPLTSVPGHVPEGPLFILSDIDGTLVPHPYFSGMPSSQRAHYVHRVAALFDDDRFGLLTGRGHTNFERLLSEASLPTTLRPALLGLEFGAHFYRRNCTLFESPACPGVQGLLAALAEAFERATVRNPTFLPKDDLATRMALGRIEGFVMEHKALIGQVDWHYSEAFTLEAFGHFLVEEVNPLLIHQPNVAVQVFPSRIDILQRGFVPKAGFFERMPGSTFKSKTPVHIIALGDELYDAYLFRYLRQRGEVPSSNGGHESSPPFASVRCYSVGRRLPHTDGHFASIDEALTQVESWLKAAPQISPFGEETPQARAP